MIYLLFGFAFLVMLFLRLLWVAKARANYIGFSYWRYQKMAPVTEMLWKIWIWNVEAFIND